MSESNLFFLFKRILILPLLLFLGISQSLATAKSCEDLFVKAPINYDFIRMTTGEAARDLFEKLAKIADAPIPQQMANNSAVGNFRFKELSFLNGHLVIRVARVEQNFDSGDVFSQEPIYYAQVLGKLDPNNKFTVMGNSEVQFLLPEVTYEMSKSGVEDITAWFPFDKKGLQEWCYGGACNEQGNSFLKWASRHNGQQGAIIIPLNKGPESIQQQTQTQTQTQPQPQSIYFVDQTETFWGDVKKLVNWFFDYRQPF